MKMNLDDLAALLGLTGGGELEQAAVEPHRREVSAHGLAGAALADFALDHGVLWHAAKVGPVRYYRCDAAPYLVDFPAEEVVEVCDGEPVDLNEEMFTFDLRRGRAVLRLAQGERPGLVVVAELEEVTALYVPVERAVELPPTNAADVAVPPPPVGEWLSAAGEPWLAQTAGQLASSDSPVDRLAAAGAVLRFAEEEEPSEGGGRAWLRALPAEAVAAVEAIAIQRAFDLDEHLAALGAASIGLRPALAAGLVRDRDDLQSCLRALRVVRLGERLAAALAAADSAALTHLTLLQDVLPPAEDDPEGERWIAVGWREPEAWWGSEE